MSKIIYYIIIVGLLFITNSKAFAQGRNTPVAGGAITVNIAVTTSAQIIPADGTNLDWCLHPDGATNIRCVVKIPNVTYTPTSSVGYEVTQSSPFCSANIPNSNPALEVDCASEGASINVSVWIDKK